MCRLVFGSVVLGVGLLMAAPAMAQERSSLSGNVALTSDYVFRGISQTGGNPAVQGGADYTHGPFYGKVNKVAVRNFI